MQHRLRPTILLSALTAGTLLAGCPLLPAPLQSAQAPSLDIAQQHARLQGLVSFPSRAIAATPTDVVRRATVSLIDVNNQTVAAALTDDAGAFSFAPGFVPAAGTFYVLEALKPLTGANAAGRVVRMRTIVQWTGSSWSSCTGAGSIVIDPTTTAVTVIEATQAGVGYPETLGVIANDRVVSTHPTLNANWQAVQELVLQVLTHDLDPLSGIVLSGSRYALASDRGAVYAFNLAQGTTTATSVMLDGSLQLTGSLPRPNTVDEVEFNASGVSPAGVISTDGTHLYMKPWDVAGTWNKIGSGFGGTTQGTNYGNLTNSTSRTLSAATYGGYVYQGLYGVGNNGTMERTALSNGAVTTVPVSPPLINRNTGLGDAGSYPSVITDGNYFYNPAFSIAGGGNNGFSLRVYDPVNNFAFVRQLSMDGSNTHLAGNNWPAQSTGFMVDGVYFYALEWNEGNSGNPATNPKNGLARLRRFRLADGQLEAETNVSSIWPSDDPLTGCYDWVNNKFWFADYSQPTIHRTAGRSFPGTGTWVSTPIDLGGVAPLYGRLNFNAVTTQGGEAVRFRVRSANDSSALTSATWYGPTGTGDYYTTSGTHVNPVHNRNRWAQIQVTLVASTDSVTVANTTPRLYGVSLEATP